MTRISGPRPHLVQVHAANRARSLEFYSAVGPLARRLRDEGQSLGQIAAALTAQGFRVRTTGAAFSAASVFYLLNRLFPAK